ncbi:MAG: 3-hydroxyacyl-CoA dehydrogenase family protein, partial [Hyphomicrobiales bacterium]
MTPASTSNKRALVVGGNSMALSHAALLAHHGFEAVLMEDDEIDAVRSLDFLKRFYEGQPSWVTDSSKPNPLPFEKLDGRFDVLIDTSDAGLDRRCQILSTVSKCLNPDALIAFQTSTPDLLIVEKITATLPTIHQFYICGQPHLATLVECAKFAGMNIDPLSQFWQMLGKQVILTKPDGPFVASRLSATLYETLDSLLLEGALPYEIDEALTKFGFQIGPYEAQDLTGLDGPFYERKQANKTLLISDRMAQEGRLGKKVGVGWYRYPGGGGAVIDPLLEDLIVEEAHFAKIE